MDPSTVTLLVLLQMVLHHAAVSTNLPSDQRTMSGYHRRGLIKDQKTLEDKNNLKWVKSSVIPQDAFFYYDKHLKKNYIARQGCELCYHDGTKLGCVTHTSPGFNTYRAASGDAEYLVNENDFEILEWKVATNGNIPPLAVDYCKNMFIVKTEGSLGTSEANKNAVVEYEFLTLNQDIEGQYLSNVHFNLDPLKTNISQDVQVLRQFTAVNNNCKLVKKQVKLEKTIEKTISFQIAKSPRNMGMAVEFIGKIPQILDAKLAWSGQRTLTLSNTSSTTEKTINSLTVEIEVPPNHYCSTEMTSVIYEASVEFTGELTRIYRNKAIRKTSVSGLYFKQDVGEIKTSVELCKPITNPVKCTK